MDTRPVIKIGNVDVLIKEYVGTRVLSLDDIDALHQKPSGTFWRSFCGIQKNLVEKVDYYSITPIMLENAKSTVMRTFGINISRPRGEIYLTETGYIILMKAYVDKLSLDIQRQLIDSYFNKKPDIRYRTSTDTPLNYDELAAFMVYTTQVLEQNKCAMETVLEHQTSCLNTIGNIVSGFCEFQNKMSVGNDEKISKLIGLLAHSEITQPIMDDAIEKQQPDSVVDGDRKSIFDKKWQERVQNQIAEEAAAKNSGYMDALSKVYQLMKCDYDIDKMKKESNFKCSMIAFISSNDDLKKSFESNMKKIFARDTSNTTKEKPKKSHKQMRDSKTGKIYESIAAKSIPEEIVKMMEPLLPYYNGQSSYLSRVLYREVEKVSGLDLDKMTKAYAKQIGYKQISKAYMISKDEKLMRIMGEVIEKLQRAEAES